MSYKINHINKIFITKLNKNNYFVIEFISNDIFKRIALNISKGIDESDNIFSFNKKVIYLYVDGKEFQDKIELNCIRHIILLSNVELINKSTNKNISSPYLIEILDYNNESLFIDLILNQTYTRNGHYKLKLFDNSKQVDIYVEGESTNIFFQKMTLRICKYFQPILSIDEEGII